MQHTEVLELNACIGFLRTGKETARDEFSYDMTWTFTAPRDPTITEIFCGSPGEEAWMPTAADIKTEQQRRLKEKEEELRREKTPQPVQKPAAKELTPIPLSGLRAPIEFKKRPVAGRRLEGNKSLLTSEISQAKKGGPVVGGTSSQASNPNVPSMKLTIYLPDRQGVEIRVAKTATVEQAIVAILERAKEKLRKKKADKFEMRMHDSDGLPDDDFPALDRTSVISEMGSSEFCLCELATDGDTSEDEQIQESSRPNSPVHVPPTPATPAPSVVPTSNITRNKSLGMTKSNIIKVIVKDNDHHDKHSAIEKVAADDSRASTFLRKIVKALALPLFAEEYQLQVTEEDRERLMMVTTVLQPNDDLLSLGVETLLLRKRRFADAPPDADQLDALKTTAGKEARRVSEVNKEPGKTRAVPKVSDLIPADKNTGGVTGANDDKKNDGTTTTPMNAQRSQKTNSRSNKKDKKTSNAVDAVDPESILLNEIKAAVYEEWKVVKTNNWGKNQNRILGIDLQKIYNKPRSEGGFGQSVKHAERLISDVVSIDINPNNPAAFTIKVRDGPGNAVVVLNYEAEGASDAAAIVAKVKYIREGMQARN